MNKFTQYLVKTLSGVDVKQLLQEKEELLALNKQLADDLSNVKQEMLYARTQFAGKSQELDATLAMQEDLHIALADWEKKAGAQADELERLLSEKKEWEQKCVALEEQLATSKSENSKTLAEQSKNVTEQAQQLAELSQRIQDLETQLAASKGEVEQKEQELATQSALIESQSQQLEVQSQQLEESVKTIASLETQNTSLKNQQESQAQQLTEQSEVISSQALEITSLTQSLELKSAELAQQSKECRAHSDSLAEQSKSMTEQAQQLAELSQRIQDLETQLAASKGEVEQKEQELAAQFALVESQSQQLEVQSKQLETQSQQFENQLQQITTQSQQLDESTKIISSLKAQNTSLENQLEAQLHMVLSLQEMTASLQSKWKQAVEEKELLQKQWEEMSATKTSAEETSTEEISTEEASALEVPEEDASTDEASTDEASTDEASTEETSVLEVPAEEVSVEETEGKIDEAPQTNAVEENLLDAYQEVKVKLEENAQRYPYTRVTLASTGTQYLFESKSLQVKTELFIWGIEGKEIVLDEPQFISHDEIATIEGLESPFATEKLVCDFSEEGNGAEVAEMLLMAICSYRPVCVSYRDKNGRVSDRNLYWICFQSNGTPVVKLPNVNLFADLFNGEMDTENVLAMCAHVAEPRTFIINQILSIQVYDAFFTTAQGIDALRTGLRAALLAEQDEVADLIYQCLPEQYKEEADVKSSRAHYMMLVGEFEKAAELYLSMKPDALVKGKTTWAEFNVAQINEFIEKDIQAEKFTQLKEALKAEGWNI